MSRFVLGKIKRKRKMGKAARLKSTPCKVCGKYSGKRNVCAKCKEEFPFEPKDKGSVPFNRSVELEKKRRRERKYGKEE